MVQKIADEQESDPNIFISQILDLLLNIFLLTVSWFQMKGFMILIPGIIEPKYDYKKEFLKRKLISTEDIKL